MPSGVGTHPGRQVCPRKGWKCRGVVSQVGLVELLGARPVFDGKDVGTCLQKLKEMGLVGADRVSS